MANPSHEEMALARRRYEKFVELTAGEKDWKFEEILDQLPLDGAPVLECGHTRYDHVLKD